jgi:outer membrane cobalamin receptor
MPQKNNYKWILIGVFIWSSIGILEAATIEGRVIDSYNHAGVAGATVFFDNQKNYAITDAQGIFRFSDLPVGEYSIRAKSIDYHDSYSQTLIIKTISDHISFDIYMKPNTVSMQAVQITGNANKETDISARNDERVAPNVINVISAKTIESLPDQNVADIMQRVSGVSMTKNSFGSNSNLELRGMPPRYSSVLVDGVVMPSTSSSGRSVSLDIFGSELVGRIEVIKSVTPDLEANAIAGTVNIKMKQAPDTGYLKLQVASGFNQYYFNHNIFTFDNSSVMSKDFYEKNGPDYLADESVFPRKNLIIKSERAIPDLGLNLSGGKRFLDNKLGVMFALGLQSTSMANTYDAYSYTADVKTNLPSNDVFEHQVYSKKQTRFGGYAKIDYQFNRNNQVSLYSSFFQIDELRARKFADLQLSENSQTYIRPIETQTETDNSGISCTALKGEHKLSEILNFDWTLIYAAANAQSPDFARVDEAQAIGDPVYLNYNLPLRRTWQWDVDQNKSGYLNIIYRPTLFHHLFEFKAGGMYRSKYRRNYANDYYFQPYDQPSPMAYENYPNPDLLTVPFQNNENNQEKIGNAEVNSGNYRAWENIGAGYGMVTVAFGKLQILTGVRFETTNFRGEVHQNSIQVPISITTQTYYDFFPSFHLTYKLNEKQNLRFSIYRAMNRPDFTELIPYSDPRAGTTTGNDKLKPAYGNCLDIRYEIYPQKEEVFTAGVFYKKIDNAIEEIIKPDDSKNVGNVTTPTITYGLELVAMKYFGNLGVSANYTYTQSKISAQALDFLYTDGVLTSNPLVNYKRTLIGQSPHLFNLSVTYRTNWGFKTGVSYTMQSYNLIGVASHLHYNTFQGNYHNLGLSIEQKIGKRFFINTKVSNLLNSPVTWLMKEENNTLVRKAYNYQNYFIGLKISL